MANAKSTASAKQGIRVTFSRSVGNGNYENVFSADKATGIHVHRNDATAKEFKAKVSSVAQKLTNHGFKLFKQESDYAGFARQTAQDIDEFMKSLEEAPF